MDAEDLTTHAIQPGAGAALTSQQLSSLKEALGRLASGEREALCLREIQGLPVAAIAVRLGCSTATVRLHIACARIALRNHLALVRTSAGLSALSAPRSARHLR